MTNSKNIDITNPVDLKPINTKELGKKSNQIFKILGIKNPTDEQKYNIMIYLHEIS